MGYRVLRNPLAKLANFCPNSHTVRLTEQQSSDLGRISVKFKPFDLRGNLSVWAETWSMLKFYRSMQQSAHVAVSGVIAAHIAVPKINILEASRI